jgi:hypothetical protein
MRRERQYNGTIILIVLGLLAWIAAGGLLAGRAAMRQLDTVEAHAEHDTTCTHGVCSWEDF